MKHISFIVLVFFFSSCNTNATKETAQNEAAPADTTNIQTGEDETEPVDTTDYDHATYFVIVADTGLNYFPLQTKMYALSSRLSIPIDTMGRHYNAEKNLIALADDDEDEIYAGDYYPRRYPSDNLSLEYLEIYQRDANDKTIALIAGICETEKSADSLLAILKRQEPNCFKLKSELYIGCMH